MMNYFNARGSCSVVAGSAFAGTDLMQISTTYEMALVSSWAGNIRNYWVCFIFLNENKISKWNKI